jgi:MerR family mercuric resistance operon transcriptional regulator
MRASQSWTKEMQDAFTIGEFAKRTAVNIETIRYYERVGLMPPPTRTAGGRRVYDESDQRTLGFIRKARELGFHIADTRALLALRVADACTDVMAIAQRHLETVRAEMRRTAEVERVLSEAVGRCPGGVSANACAVLKVLEHAI